MSNIHVNKFGKYYDLIKTLYNEGKRPKEIAKIINDKDLTPKAISKIASANGFATIKMSSNKVQKKFEEIDKKAIKMIRSGMSCSKTAKELGIDQQSMNNRLRKKFNLNVLPDGKKQINSHYFDVIDSEEKAYWLGFLYADGNISSEGNRLEVRLSIKDIKHLEKFRKFLNLETEFRTGICNGNGYCHLSVRNKHIWE